ncbi:hypothetical protein BJ912DRAFT_859179 [Pholiota molesta]|nr:hypothetical protein BJ912DRAFT_859179 [Pholiota molesta]
MKRSYHEAVVKEMLESISANEVAGILDKRLKTVRDRSVTWLWNAYRAVNNVELVRKAFEMCTVREWNLSYSSLMSFEARDKLRNLKTTDPEFWNELTSNKEEDLPAPEEIIPEDTTIDDGDAENLGDDSSIPLPVVIRSTMQEDNVGGGVIESMHGGLVSSRLAEKDEEPIDAIDGPAAADTDVRTVVAGEAANVAMPSGSSTGNGTGKRRRFANTRYTLKDFIRHDDNDASDAEA